MRALSTLNYKVLADDGVVSVFYCRAGFPATPYSPISSFGNDTVQDGGSLSQPR
jgi:hypothetical protein